MEINLHVSKIFNFQRQLSKVDNQINRLDTSKLYRFRIFSNTHHRIHKLRLFILIHGFLLRLLCALDNVLLTIVIMSHIQLIDSLDLHNLPRINNLYLDKSRL